MKKLETALPIIKLQSESVFGYWFGNSVITISIGIILFNFFGNKDDFYAFQNILFLLISGLGLALGYVSYNIYIKRILSNSTAYIPNTNNLRLITQSILVFITLGLLIGIYKKK